MDKEAGPKIDWLNEGDLFKGQNQDFLNHLQTLEDEGHDVDPLAPFLLKEHRAGNINHWPDHGDYGPSPYALLRKDLPKWSDWYRSRAFNRPNVNLMDPDYTVHNIRTDYNDWYHRHEEEAPYIYDTDDLDNADHWYENNQNIERLPRTVPKELEDHEQEGDPTYDWDNIVQSLAPDDGRRWRGGYYPEDGQKVYDHAKKHGYIPELGHAYQNWRDTAMEQWNDYYDRYHDFVPLTAEEYGLQTPVEENHPTPQAYQEAVAQHQGDYEEMQHQDEQEQRDEAWAEAPVGHMVDHMNELLDPHGVLTPTGYQYYNEPPQQPGAGQQVVGSTGRDPRYYRWVFHPHDTTVTLDHNETDHPAYVKTHRDLAKDAPGPHPLHGYAYKIHGGWRLTTYEHQPVEDPFVVAQVVQQLRGQKTRPGRTSTAWDAVEPDFEQLRYGQPFEDS